MHKKISSNNLVHLLQKSSTPALITAQGNRLSFSELYDRIGRFAGGLTQRGVKQGDRIVLLIPMSIDLYIALLGVLWVGATVVLVDPSAPVDAIVKRFALKGFIGSTKAHLLRLRYASLRGLDLYVSTGFTPLWHHRMSSLNSPPPPIAEAKHPALLTFTTGSTGQPKAIARSHQFLLDQHTALSHHMFFEQGDVDLPTLPVFLLHSLAGGATCILADADLSKVASVQPDRIIAQMEQYNITSMSGSPAFFAPIVAHLVQRNRTFTGVKRIFTGGARVNSDVLRGLCETFPEADVFVVYGSTEAEPIAVLNGRVHLSALREGERTGKGALVGTPVAEIRVWIDNTEILVAGNHVNPKYYKEPLSDAKNKVLRDNVIWHRTGDAGYLDTDGQLWLLGRANEQIAGLWPMVVEAQAESFPFVQKAGLAEKDGRPVLVVELSNPPEDWKSQLQSICPVVLNVAKIPVDPRHNAKIVRAELNSLLQKHPLLK